MSTAWKRVENRRWVDEAEEGKEYKRVRLQAVEEDSNDMVRVSLVAINGLASAVQGITGQMDRSEKKEEQIDKTDRD